MQHATETRFVDEEVQAWTRRLTSFSRWGRLREFLSMESALTEMFIDSKHTVEISLHIVSVCQMCGGWMQTNGGSGYDASCFTGDGDSPFIPSTEPGWSDRLGNHRSLKPEYAKANFGSTIFLFLFRNSLRSPRKAPGSFTAVFW